MSRDRMYSGRSDRGGGGGGRGRGRGRGGGGGGRGNSRGGPRRHGGGGGRHGGRHGGPRNNGSGRYSRGRRDYQRNRGMGDGGNQRERIAVESGSLVFIDQFMLANPQFIERLGALGDQDPDLKDTVVRDYGGCVVALDMGTYRIERDPFAYSIIVHPEGYGWDRETEISKVATDAKGHVFIDTRCIAMIDRELLDDRELLEKYKKLWFGGQDKACRDLLRDNGGAVRYGFERYGDELGIYAVPDESVVCLWPDVAEAVMAEDTLTDQQ